MAMEQDGCSICEEAENRIKSIAGTVQIKRSLFYQCSFITYSICKQFSELANLAPGDKPILLQVRVFESQY